MLSGRSFMKMRNMTGPRTDPWGTPDSTGTGSEAWPSSFFFFFFTLRKLAFGRFQSQIGRLCAGLFVVVD